MSTLASSNLGHGRLIVWQRSMDLLEVVYVVVRSLPQSDRFPFCDQLLRSSLSVPSNIAEGCAHGPGKAYTNYLRIARGSLNELATQLTALRRLRLASEELLTRAESLADEVGRMLTMMHRRALAGSKAKSPR